MIAGLLVAWAAVLAATIWWLLSRQITPAAPSPGPRADPHAGEMARWRRAVHDWTRDN